ncbi:hypothetical protein HPB48_004255 [Haemaphysalis longicornis]|uniref:acetylcholinesterase n=1 Tax=Haemaphysalis longicornis TaxID=44386 RepID=A0A9J6GM82_HAELO|nr:hypothetical protein HPB48_004255 [Haemaphysalis longicornis]
MHKPLLFLALPLGLLPNVITGSDRRTSLGIVRGNRISLLNRVVEEYRGIPYACPPVGDLRFLPPVPAPRWEGTLDARNGRTACPQAPNRFLMDAIVLTEDCLYVNVWTPVPRWADATAPVLVWIHGGGFTTGSASYDNYTAAALAARTGFVVASMNYRLGILGFLNADVPEAPGNLGLMDQRLALWWLQRNARAFGGDPAMFTVMGHSAGGMSVHSHMLSPGSRGLFRRAVMMSGTMSAVDFFESVEQNMVKGRVVAELVGCSDADQTLDTHPAQVLACLRSKSAGELVRAAAKAVAPRSFHFLPTFHSDFLPRIPIAGVARGFVTNIDILTGVTADEGSTPFAMLLRPQFQSERLTEASDMALRSALQYVVHSWTQRAEPEMLNRYASQAADKESLRERHVAYLSHKMFVCPMHFTAEHHAARGNAVYTYVFAHRSQMKPPSWRGAGHAMELPFFFGRPMVDRDDFAEEDVRVSEGVVKMLSTFAETG